jgi:hypothetical protein
MLSIDEVEQQYERVKRELARLDQERDDFLQRIEADRADYAALLETYQRLLKRRGVSAPENGRPKQPTLGEAPSNTDLFIKALTDNPGIRMHVNAIWETAERMGAKSKTDDKAKLVDGTLRQVIERNPNGPIRSLGNRCYIAPVVGPITAAVMAAQPIAAALGRLRELEADPFPED